MPRHPNLSEDALIALYRQSGEVEWLGELLQRHTVLLLGVALKYLKEGEAAADAVQSVFLKALTRFPEGEIQNLKGWLYILLRNHCLQVLRDKQRHLPEEALATIAAPAEKRDWGASPERSHAAATGGAPSEFAGGAAHRVATVLPAAHELCRSAGNHRLYL